MADRLGPRACKVCGPGRIEGCWRCKATMGHRHVNVLDRQGRVVGQVAVCGSHLDVPTPGPVKPQRPAPSPSAIAKRRRDRERRAAHRIVLDRHADEVAQVLADIREGTDG